MSSLDDAITALEHLGGRLDVSRCAAGQAVDATSDALDAAAAFGAEAHVATLVEVHDDLADATGTLTASNEQAHRALVRLLVLRGDQAVGRGDTSAPEPEARRSRKRGRAPGGRARSRASQAEARRRDRGGWRDWGEPSDHVATYSPKVAGYAATVAGLVGMTQSALVGVVAATGVFALDVAATMYQNAKAARRNRERDD